jgi:poly-gamma-glutamate capsule biosynthesis protein CapA/YwtB (metallophosphatase superfamily)
MFRSDLTLMYLPAIDPGLGPLVEALLMPMRVARFRLNRAVGADAEWLCDLLNRLGTRGELGPDYSLSLHPFT